MAIISHSEKLSDIVALLKCAVYITKSLEVLAIRHVFSLIDMITNTNFSNCTLVFKIGAVRQHNMQSKHQNTFQNN